ncbi:MAG: sensor domain-containing diguanylate cyclase [Calditrichaeota bacterium]|nr:MAG: sensor domain-containing diguanylate cyclase [Calditrichota bacterium]
MPDELVDLQNQIKQLRERYQEIELANKRLKQRLTQIDTLYSVAAKLGTILDLDELFDYVKKIFTIYFKVHHFSLLILENHSRRKFVVKNFLGISPDLINHLIANPTDYIQYSVIKTKKCVHVQDTSREDGNHILLPSHFVSTTGSYLCIPLMDHHKKVLGVLNLFRKNKESFSTEDVEIFIKIGAQIAVALEKNIMFEQTKEQSITDELTGIFNRRYFNQRLEREIQRSKRYEHSLALILLDIDHFKNYNDLHGHLKGDKLLRKLARILDNNLRSADILARYGGEEFVIILPEISKEQAKQVADKLRNKVENTRFEHGESQPEGKVTISLGIAVFPEDARHPHKLVECADQALYLAKTSGRNRIAWHGMSQSELKGLPQKFFTSKHI